MKLIFIEYHIIKNNVVFIVSRNQFLLFPAQHNPPYNYDIFENVKQLDAKDVKIIQNLYKSEDFDFHLKPGSAAVDKGIVIPQVTDGFTGAAPDLGALEVGQPLPHYGPRDN